jgi:dienelactone hydrolase
MALPRFEAPAGEPLDLWLGPSRSRLAAPAIRELRFEFSSRGDRVPGRLLLPEASSGPFPLVLLEHGAGGSKEAPYLEATAFPWVRAGAGVGSIDLPLHGERESGKLTQRFLNGLRFDAEADSQQLASGLWRELVRQGVSDLRRALDGLVSLPEIDAGRVTFAAFSLGSIVGACFCGVDPRPQAAALALGAGGFGPPDLDPARLIARFAPRPVLFVSARRDERIPRRAAEALFEGAREPKRRVWVDCGHGDLPGSALKTMWTFLREPLGLPSVS